MILTATLVRVVCCECGVEFGMPDYVVKVRRQDQANLYCPMGHQQIFSRTYQSEMKILQDKVNALAASREHEHQQRLAAEATTTRLRKQQARERRRASAGVCPCCHRTFIAIARHMKTKHPDYK